MAVPPNTWNRPAAVLFIALALSLVRCAPPPPPAPPPPSPLRPSVFELDGLTMNQNFVVEHRRPLMLYFHVPHGRILEIDVDPPPDFDGRYTVRSVLRDEVVQWDLLDRPARIRLANLESGRYELRIVTKDTFPRRLSIRIRMPLPAPAPPPPPPQKERDTKKGTDRPTSPKRPTPPPAPGRCAKVSDDAERLADGQTTSGLFTQKGRNQQRWFGFRLRQRARVTVELTMRNKHPVAIALLDANGCSKKQATKVREFARLKTTIDPGAYFIRVSTDVQRSRNAHFRIRVDIEGQGPKKPVLPQSRSQSPPPLSPPQSPVLRCIDLSVPASGEWIVVLDPIAPNDPPTRLRLQLSHAGTEVRPLSVPDRQPCLIVNRYRLEAGRYTACAITTDTSYRPNVSLKAEATNPQKAPYVEVLRDCQR